MCENNRNDFILSTKEKLMLLSGNSPQSTAILKFKKEKPGLQRATFLRGPRILMWELSSLQLPSSLISRLPRSKGKINYL